MTRPITVPESWLTDIEDALKHPERFKFAGFDDSDKGNSTRSVRALRTIIPQYLREQYDIFHSRATAASTTKGEQEAIALLNFYVVLKYRLWRAEYETRYEYIRDVCNEPFAISESTLNHFSADIESLLAQGLTIENAALAFGKAKGATVRLLDIPNDKMPGGDINQAAQIVSTLSPAEAHRYLDDIEQKDVTQPVSALHDSTNNRLYLEVQVTHPMPQGAKDPFRDRYTITCMDCPRAVAEWMVERLHVRMSRREYK